MTSLASSNIMHIAAAVVFASASITDYLDGYLAENGMLSLISGNLQIHWPR